MFVQINEFSHKLPHLYSLPHIHVTLCAQYETKRVDRNRINTELKTHSTQTMQFAIVALFTASFASPIICNKMMPICDCSATEDCQIIPQSANSCAKAVCIPQKPLICTKQMPVCEDECGSGRVCKVFPATNEECPRAACVSTTPAFACNRMMPFCKEECGPNEFCKVFPATLEECSRAACVRK
jgi:hypothetical protein